MAGQHGMVSSGHPLATLAGLEVLRSGGSAVDAAIAAGTTSCVVLPHACGVGGDIFAVGYDAAGARLWAINGSGKAPQAATLAHFPHGMREDEIASSTIPGAVHGWAEMCARYGRKRLPELLAAAERWAAEGFLVDPTLAMLVAANDAKLRKHPTTAQVFTSGDGSLKPGDVLRQPDLARTLRRIASSPEDFYRGEVASRLAHSVAQQGGLFASADLAAHASRWEEPIATNYHGYSIYVSPPNSIGILLLVQLALLDADALTRMGHNSAAYIKELIGAKRAAFAHVLPLLCDPDALPVSVSTILSQEFIRNLRRAPVAMAGREVADTTAIIAADADGNVVTLIQSLYFHFGCGVVAGDTGVMLNNRMMGFSTMPGSPNVVTGGRRPAHTLTPTVVMRDTLPALAIATPGAFAQTQSLCQLLNNILVFGLELQQAIEAPRWFDDVDNSTLIEKRISPETIADLESPGYDVKVGSDWEAKTGNVQAIKIEHTAKGRILYGAADLRRNGLALGW